MENLTLQGTRVPRIGLGTWNLRGDICRKTVIEAFAMGYRHIDTAEMYRNEHQIGQGLAQSDVDRDDVFLVSKVWTSNLRYADTRRACDESLRRLKVDTIDLYLIHWPSAEIPLEETLQAMKELQAMGKIQHAGVSNFSPEHMNEARRLFQAPLFCNQVPFHPYHHQAALLERCIQEEMLLTAYSPLAKGRVARDATLQEIGHKYNKTAAQVSLRWLLQHQNVAVIPKASHGKHLKDNLAIFDFALDEADIQKIAPLDPLHGINPV